MTLYDLGNKRVKMGDELRNKRNDTKDQKKIKMLVTGILNNFGLTIYLFSFEWLSN